MAWCFASDRKISVWGYAYTQYDVSYLYAMVFLMLLILWAEWECTHPWHVYFPRFLYSPCPWSSMLNCIVFSTRLRQVLLFHRSGTHWMDFDIHQPDQNTHKKREQKCGRGTLTFCLYPNKYYWLRIRRSPKWIRQNREVILSLFLKVYTVPAWTYLFPWCAKKCCVVK